MIQMVTVSQSEDSKNIKLLTLLRKLFQYENADLDFGMYRILNLKKKEISDFINTEIIQNIHNALQTTKKNRPIDSMQRDFDLICEHLIDFFSRYYDNGDFISKRRYSKNGLYSIPYNGEDVFFYWANQDQYYIKSGENFRFYSWEINGYKIIFEIVQEEVKIEKSNNKDIEKKFYIYNSTLIGGNQEVRIRFGYRPLELNEQNEIFSMRNKKTIDQSDLIEYNYKKMIEDPGIQATSELFNILTDNSTKEACPLLKTHLRKFMMKNTADFFIHKNLAHFLKQELQNYIKNEFLSIDTLETEKITEIMENTHVFKEISTQIIDLLGQIEGFQKRLWEKTKFIISTHYCICLDLIPDLYLIEIFSNKRQLEEWQSYCISFDFLGESRDSSTKSKEPQARLEQFGKKKNFEQKNDGLEKIREFVRLNPGLMVDTKYFDFDFKIRLLNEVEELDKKVSGILINSDNFHGLKLLQNTFKEKIKAIYIDPPYNAKTSEILYKNTFKHSSWLCMMENRISLSRNLLRSNDGVFVCAIDENENEGLAFLLDFLFGYGYKRTAVSIVHNPRGIQGKAFSYCHEFAHFVYPSDLILAKKRLENEKQKPLMKTGGESERNSAKNCFYPIYYKYGKIELGSVLDENMHPKGSQILKEDGTIELWPICSEGKERKWRYTKDSLLEIIDHVSVKQTQSGQYVVYLSKDQESFKTVWTDSKYNAAEYGSTLLKNIIPTHDFSFPKSLYTVKDCLYIQLFSEKSSTVSENMWVLDFFAGSGTTAHAIMELNAELSHNHRFILIEMGEYFENVLKERVKKLIYSAQWKEGKPMNISKSGGKIVKYHTLEQFEDSVLNIQLKEVKNNDFVENYQIKYMYPFESKDSDGFLNIDKLDCPFSYKMKVMTDNGVIFSEIDLIETFNYILGIYPTKISFNCIDLRKYVWIEGILDVKFVIVIWRPTDNNFDPLKDKEIIEKQILRTRPFDRIFLNGNYLIENAESIEFFFKKNI